MYIQASLLNQDGWILTISSLFGMIMDLDSQTINAQKRAWQISSHLDQTSLIKKGFITCLGLKNNFLHYTVHNPHGHDLPGGGGGRGVL